MVGTRRSNKGEGKCQCREDEAKPFTLSNLECGVQSCQTYLPIHCISSISTFSEMWSFTNSIEMLSHLFPLMLIKFLDIFEEGKASVEGYHLLHGPNS